MKVAYSDGEVMREGPGTGIASIGEFPRAPFRRLVKKRGESESAIVDTILSGFVSGRFQ